MQMVVTNDRPIAQAAKELQINDGTYGNWVKLSREENPEHEPVLKPSDRVRQAGLEGIPTTLSALKRTAENE